MATAPWYKWTAPDGSPRAGVPRFGRGTGPTIQKFAHDDFVNAFLKDAQRSVAFDEDVDRVHAVHRIPVSVGAFAGKVGALFPVKSDGTPWRKGDPMGAIRKSQLVPTETRKIYLPTHARHYIVGVELHCDIPGFPPVPDGEVCQAGFVVRRRRANYPKEARAEAQKLIAAIVGAQARLGELDETIPLRPNAAKNRAVRNARLRATGRFESARADAEALVMEKRDALKKWQVAHGVAQVTEGWIEGPQPGIGTWQAIDDTPEILAEAAFPLYRLFADPTVPAHDAAGRAFYFGVVPTLEPGVTPGGKPRFDDRSTYETRCFFRRHDPRCPRSGLNVNAPDCGGALVWSEATEPYRLASQFDLLGTANRPVTIQMPDLGELAAQAMARPVGRFSSAGFAQPQSLQPQTDGTGVTGGRIGGGQICFFAIPLITIVAFFVLNLFLPIVVFLFGLWFLLALKLCILPSFEFDGALQAELSAIPPKAGVDAGFEVDVDAPGFSLTVGGSTMTGGEIRTELVSDLAHAIAEQQGYPRTIGGAPNPAHDPRAAAIEPSLDDYSNAPLVGMSNAFHEQAQKTKADAEGGVLDIAAGLVLEPKRISQWKHEKVLPTTGEYE